MMPVIALSSVPPNGSGGASATAGALLFYLFAALAVGGALAVAFSKHIVRAAVALLFTLGGVAGLYALLHAPFLAVAQIVVYVGGTLVLIIFGVMLTSARREDRFAVRRWELVWGGLLAILLAVGLASVAIGAHWHSEAVAPPRNNVAALGRALLAPGRYLAVFELSSVLLLAVMVGAAYLARGRRR